MHMICEGNFLKNQQTFFFFFRYSEFCLKDWSPCVCICFIKFLSEKPTRLSAMIVLSLSNAVQCQLTSVYSVLTPGLYHLFLHSPGLMLFLPQIKNCM